MKQMIKTILKVVNMFNIEKKLILFCDFSHPCKSSYYLEIKILKMLTRMWQKGNSNANCQIKKQPVWESLNMFLKS